MGVEEEAKGLGGGKEGGGVEGSFPRCPAFSHGRPSIPRMY